MFLQVVYDRSITAATPQVNHHDTNKCVYFIASTKSYVIQKCARAPFICEEFSHLHPEYPDEGIPLVVSPYIYITVAVYTWLQPLLNFYKIIKVFPPNWHLKTFAQITKCK